MPPFRMASATKSVTADSKVERAGYKRRASGLVLRQRSVRWPPRGAPTIASKHYRTGHLTGFFLGNMPYLFKVVGSQVSIEVVTNTTEAIPK